jgi:hypothetical protein
MNIEIDRHADPARLGDITWLGGNEPPALYGAPCCIDEGIASRLAAT